jgi:hypothetical protein
MEEPEGLKGHVQGETLTGRKVRITHESC